MKFMPLSFRPLKLVLEKIVCIYHDFFLELSTVFISSTTLLFALSSFVFVSNFYLLPGRFMFGACTLLYFLVAFKNGGKTKTFGLARSLCFHRDFDLRIIALATVETLETK
jgi:hypothetical protein